MADADLVFENSSEFAEFHKRFYEEVDKHYKGLKETNLKKPWTKDHVQYVKNIVHSAKQKELDGVCKSSDEYYYNSKYEVLEVGQETVLFCKNKKKSDSAAQILPLEEYFQRLWTTHKNCGHGGRDKMCYDLKRRFYIPKPIVQIFVTQCKVCEGKKPQLRKGIVVRPIISRELNDRGQVDLIDLQSTPDGDYKWLMNFQDHNTKFTHLRPLRTKEAAGVAVELLKIFLEFGAPSILQSDNGKEFVAAVISDLMKLWPDCQIIRGKPRHPQSQGSVERCNQDVENMLRAWCHDNNSKKWSIGCLFVQFQKNSSYHRIIKRSPYRAMFGLDPRMGLTKSVLPQSILKNISEEEQLEAVLNAPSIEAGTSLQLPNHEANPENSQNIENFDTINSGNQTNGELINLNN